MHILLSTEDADEKHELVMNVEKKSILYFSYYSDIRCTVLYAAT